MDWTGTQARPVLLDQQHRYVPEALSWRCPSGLFSTDDVRRIESRGAEESLEPGLATVEIVDFEGQTCINY